MFEEEAEEYANRFWGNKESLDRACTIDNFKDGAEFGYNKALEEVKHDLMMKLKDEGIVKPLKDSIFRNERLSSQEQQELCAWIECAMEFGENLDECAKELEEVNKANEWHYVKDGDLPKGLPKPVLVAFNNKFSDRIVIDIARYSLELNKWWFIYDLKDLEEDVIAWKEIVLPKESE